MELAHFAHFVDNMPEPRTSVVEAAQVHAELQALNQHLCLELAESRVRYF
jgi:hypothetical protein